MSKILLSIKPEYCERILAGTKKFEFRRRVAKKAIKGIVIYSSFPKMVVVGEVDIIDTIVMDPMSLWEHTKEKAGISKEKYSEYFKGCKTAYAYRLGNTKTYELPKTLKSLGIAQAPQSFIYLPE